MSSKWIPEKGSQVIDTEMAAGYDPPSTSMNPAAIEESSAPVDWEAIARQRERELRQAGEATEALRKRAEQAEAATEKTGRVANERGAALEWVRLALRRWDEQPRKELDDAAELASGIRAALGRAPSTSSAKEDTPT